MWNIDYNVHDLLKIRIARNGQFDLGRKLKYISFGGNEDLENTDIVLNIGKFSPTNNNCDFISHKYYVKENYIYCKDKGRNTRWEVEIIGFEEGKTTINFSGKDSGLKGILFPTFLAQEFLIPIIEYKLAQNNHFLVHAGEVSKDSNAYVFAGRPGAYKTTLIMDLIRKANFTYLGDERIIISKDNILSFPRMFFFFEYMLNNMSTEECSFFDKVNSLKYNLRKRNEISVPLVDPSKLKALFLISRLCGNDVNITELPFKKGIEKLIVNNKAEFVSSTPITPIDQFYKYMMVYSLIFPDNKIANHWDNLYDGLINVLENVPIYEIQMPYEYDPGIFNAILKFIDSR